MCIFLLMCECKINIFSVVFKYKSLKCQEKSQKQKQQAKSDWI